LKPLSFIIITYNREADTLELLQNICSLAKATDLLQEIIVVNNASTDSYSRVKAFVAGNQLLPFLYFDAPENLGVTKGRNYALQYATGDICIFLDDDALLQNNDALEQVLRAFSKPGFNGRETAIVSFKVLYHSNLAMQQNALPHKNYHAFKNKDCFFTYFFAGGAHAIKRTLLEEVGLLPEEFFYGMEEYDLSYRLINKGFCIRYDAGIVMLHKESPLGRKPKSEKLRMMWVNKSKVAYRYLPKQYFYSTALLWSFQFLKATSFNIRGFVKGWQQIIAIPNTEKEKRMPLNNTALAYLKEVKARLWY
jgi:GT2 family glycosyltransferase